MGGGRRPAQLSPATATEFGRQLDAILQVRGDRLAVLKIVDKLPASERQMLPDVVDTVEKLSKRAENLARMLQTMSAGMDEAALPRLDEKIETLRRQAEGAERDRQLGLVERQRQAFADLTTTRQSIEDGPNCCRLRIEYGLDRRYGDATRSGRLRHEALR